MTYSIFDVIKDVAKGTTEYATDSVKDNRISICEQCPSLKRALRICGECGCLVNAKVKYTKSSCPLGKW